MLHFLTDKLHHFVIPFRTSIQIIFSALFVLAIIALTLIAHVRLSQNIKTIAYKLASERSIDLDKGINDELATAKSEANYAVYLLQSWQQNSANLIDIAKITQGVLQTKAKVLPSVASIFWANTQGDLVRSKLKKDGSIETEIMKFHKNQPEKNKSTHNINANTFPYDPRERPWYRQAILAKSPIVTDLYQFVNYSIPAWGLTVAEPAYQKGKLIGVFGLHLRLDFFRQLIESIPISTHGTFFIVTDGGHLVAFPKLIQNEEKTLKPITFITTPGISKAFNLYKKTGHKEFSFIENNKRYMAAFSIIQTLAKHQWIIGVVIPEADFIQPITHTSFMLIAIGLFILLVGLLIIAKLSSQIVRPLKNLTDEAEKIKNFNLNKKSVVKSHIKEIILLTKALNAMKKGLQSFQKYVPATLVRQIVSAGDNAEVGGAKRQVVTFFSDIKGFSSIAEKIEPHRLMSHLCDYFDALTQIIQREQGTIDKYIGDAIMAFWGAPQVIAKPCHHAALAALDCAQVLKKLNAEWQIQGLPPLTTRIGLHTGEAIIGNLGSHERMNYTAIGDAVNIASRLQDSNKLYGTAILVSSDVYAEIQHDFTLRMVDLVFLKGKTEAQFIYELIGKISDRSIYNITYYNANFAEGFNYYQEQKWAQAILAFKHCARIYPKDKVAPLFIKRCQYCKQIPPIVAWQGVWFKDWKNFNIPS